MAKMTDFDDQAERLGWLAVYPDAHRSGPCGGWSTFGTPWPIDDVGFIQAILGELMQKEAIDMARIYVTGFSRGGMLAHRLGCELTGQIAAISAVAGNLADTRGETETLASAPVRPVPILIVHGTSDRNVPIEGGASPDYPDQIAYAPLSDVVRLWRRMNGCEDVREDVRRTGSATVRSWRCANAATVELWVIEDGGHAWPGPHCLRGSPDAEVDASRVIADFFEAHPRSDRF